MSSIAFGSIFAILIAVLYIFTAIVFAFDPVQKTRNAHQYAAALASNRKYRMILHALRVATGFIGLGLIPVVYHHFAQSAWLDWVSLLGIIGYGSMIIGHTRALFALPLIVREHQEATDAVKPAIARQLSIVMLDPRGWVEIGGIGAWAFVVTLIAASTDQASTLIIVVASLFAISSILNVFGWISQRYGLINITMAIGLLLFGPMWFVWLSYCLR
jgi:hypothetical protein